MKRFFYTDLVQGEYLWAQIKPSYEEHISSLREANARNDRYGVLTKFTDVPQSCVDKIYPNHSWDKKSLVLDFGTRLKVFSNNSTEKAK